ncbi:hypothetical protein, partial [Citrobacter koseri]|uniref:hypothetical protein n=1 Tax=Citrobacter koseri TaxID=545 RepID=UPI0039C0731E
KRAYCLKTQPATGETYPKSDLFNKAVDIDKGALFLVLYGLIIVFNRLDQFFRSLKINRVQVKITASLTH